MAREIRCLPPLREALIGVAALLASGSCSYGGPTETGTPVDSVTGAVVFWMQSPAPDVAAYRVHIGESTRNYTRFEIVTAPADSVSLSDLAQDRTYYFAVTAIDSTGNESVLSDEASVDLSTG